ncbi:MAG: hypothetical protein K9H26_10725 [Prolixibacteraceae bacterium]|nr:hypothetical protein [Prolixibacteraceae bacterium]
MEADSTIRVGDKLFYIADILGLDLYANTDNVKAYAGIYGTPDLMHTFNKNDNCGKIFSFVEDSNEELWWMMEDLSFIKHSENLIAVSYLVQQGLESVEDQIAEEELEQQLAFAGFFEKIFIYAKYYFKNSKAIKIATYVIIAAIALILIVKLLKASGVKLKAPDFSKLKTKPA